MKESDHETRAGGGNSGPTVPLQQAFVVTSRNGEDPTEHRREDRRGYGKQQQEIGTGIGSPPTREEGRCFSDREDYEEPNRQVHQGWVQPAERQPSFGGSAHARMPSTALALASVPVSFWSRPWKL